jgi:hypothetical protein
MPNIDAPINAKGRYSGWYYDAKNDILEMYHKGTKVADANGSAFTLSGNFVAGGGALTPTTIVASGQISNSAGDIRSAAGNLRLGVVSAFGTTEPTSAVVMKQGTAPVGAITTSGGVFSDGTVVKKIIAAGTVSNVET